MNKFADAWKNYQAVTTTENGAKTFKTSANSNVDLFFQIGALRGQPVDRLYSLWTKAFAENPYIATRILLWARDVRGGAGERKIFRDLLAWLERNDPDVLRLVMPKIPEIGRWDDLVQHSKNNFMFSTREFRELGFEIVEAGLRARNGLCAKWMPRKGRVAAALRDYLGITDKQYRQVLVELTDVVETKMCAKDWSSIDYQKVPSLAQARYGKSFLKNDELRYREFGQKAKVYAEAVAAVSRGEMSKEELAKVEKVTVNASAVFPYDVLKGYIGGAYSEHFNIPSGKDADVVRAQWLSLPNYVGSAKSLPMIDVSGSMWSSIPKTSLKAIDISVSLGLYLANKNTGPFHNMLMTFSDVPTLVTLKGEDIVSHIKQLDDAPMGYNTSLAAAFDALLSFATSNRVPQSDMPDTILILSDMEFDAFKPNQTAFQSVDEKYSRAGYRRPNIVWWNIQSRHDNVPVKSTDNGTALVSGFSPAIVKNVLGAEGITPVDVMMKTIMNERYDLDMVKAA